MPKAISYTTLTVMFGLMISCGVEDPGKSATQPVSPTDDAESLFERPLVQVMETEEGRLLRYETPQGEREILQGSGEYRIALSSTTQLYYFQKIGAMHQVVACTWLDLLPDEGMKQSVSSLGVKELISGAELDLESILSVRPDVFLYDPADAALIDRLTSQGVRCVPFDEYRESDPMGRVEWLLVVGAICDRMELARDSLKAISMRYDSARSLAPMDARVMMLSYYQGTWSAAGAGSILSQMVRDAGGEYVLEGDRSGSVNLGLEELLSLIPDLTHVGFIYEGELSLDQLLSWEPRLEGTDLEGKTLFQVDVSQVDYFGSGILEPDVMVDDLKAIFGSVDHAGRRYFQEFHIP
ncbi:MAG: ABC transporter substrate-binding protein [Flavobacteriales bacterium]|nr:ABC transporter substrate-binding protein [Flavobacteriales bacterium]